MLPQTPFKIRVIVEGFCSTVVAGVSHDAETLSRGARSGLSTRNMGSVRPGQGQIDVLGPKLTVRQAT